MDDLVDKITDAIKKGELNHDCGLSDCSKSELIQIIYNIDTELGKYRGEVDIALEHINLALQDLEGLQ